MFGSVHPAVQQQEEEFHSKQFQLLLLLVAPIMTLPSGTTRRGRRKPSLNSTKPSLAEEKRKGHALMR